VFEAGPVLVPAADLSVSAELGRSFAAQGMTVATDTRVEALQKADGGIGVAYRGPAGPGRMMADAVFFAVGWPGNLRVGLTEAQAARQLAYPTFTEGVSMAAQIICRALGIGHFPRVWSYLGPERT